MHYASCQCFLDDENCWCSLYGQAVFSSNNVDILDNKEKVMVFVTSPSYDEVAKRVKNISNWLDPSEQVEPEGRYDVGSGPRSWMKVMHITSEFDWGVQGGCIFPCEGNAYHEEIVSWTICHKGPRLHIVVRCASARDDMTPTTNVLLVEGQIEVYSPMPMWDNHLYSWFPSLVTMSRFILSNWTFECDYSEFSPIRDHFLKLPLIST